MKEGESRGGGVMGSLKGGLVGEKRRLNGRGEHGRRLGVAGQSLGTYVSFVIRRVGGR